MIFYDIIRSIFDDLFLFKMVLKVLWGSLWIVKIFKNLSFYYMEDDGWNQFVNNNVLGENEYFIFIYEGNMCFNVNIYGLDGMEMFELREFVIIVLSFGKCFFL